MQKCPVCNSTVQKAVAYCLNCNWPLAFADADFRDPNLKQATLTWAQQKYREIGNLEREVGRIANIPPSYMNVRMTEPVAVSEPLRQEINTLNNGMQIIATEQDEHTMKINNLLDRLQAVEQILQAERKVTAEFMQQQTGENQKILLQQQSHYEVLNKHARAIQSHQTRLNELGVSPASPMQQSNGHVGSTARVAGPPPGLESSQRLPPATAEVPWIAAYNQSPQEIPSAWREQVTNVSIDPESFARLRDGDDSNIVFHKDRKGNYLILPRDGYCYLVPNKQRKIITQIYITTKAIYHCDGYNESYREFRLVKPALVSEESVDCWRLSQRGTLQFI